MQVVLVQYVCAIDKASQLVQIRVQAIAEAVAHTCLCYTEMYCYTT